MTGPRSDVFISFAKEDSAQAKTLESAFADAGLKAWTFTSKEKEVGHVMRNVLRRLRGSRCIVFLVSRSFLESGFCMDEVDLAAEYRRDVRSTLVVPVEIEDTPRDPLNESDPRAIFPSALRFSYPEKFGTREAADVAATIAKEIGIPIWPPPPPPPAPAILTTWSKDGTAVTIRVANDHPRWQETRDCLRRLRPPSKNGAWLESRAVYATEVVPALEELLGDGCCPEMP